MNQTSFQIPTVWAGRSRNRKRGLRLLPKTGGYFVHVTSRAVHRRFLLTTEEKKAFTDLMFRWADFSGLTVLTHCLMDNHFHMMIWVPPAQQVRHEEIVRRLGQVWPAAKVQAWERFHQAANAGTRRELEAELTRRMYNLPAFMRVLKQSFSVGYNERHELSGTFWEGRYRSMVVDANPEILMKVSSYIDLNPIRAKCCKDPGEYAWSGYGRAVGGDEASRKGLCMLVGFSKGQLPHPLRHKGPGLPNKECPQIGIPWPDAERIHRVWLYAEGRSVEDDPTASDRRKARPGFSSQEVYHEFMKAIGQSRRNEAEGNRCA